MDMVKKEAPELDAEETERTYEEDRARGEALVKMIEEHENDSE